MAQKNWKIDLEEIQNAARELKGIVEPTPCLFNPWLSAQYGCELYLKLENMHPIGSFKIRGSTYRISKLSEADRKKGVIAASAGNHAQGVAWGSRRLGVDALIVMPIGAPLIKMKRTKSLGAQIVSEGETFGEAMAAARRIEEESGRVFIHAYEDPQIIAGQGTCGLEILEQCPDVECVVSSMGGGGLMAGVATAIRALKPDVDLIGCQSEGASPLVQSIRQKKLVKLKKIHTFSDGIAMKEPSEKMFQLLLPLLDEVVEVDDEQTAVAILDLMEKARAVVEGSGAVPLAALEKLRDRVQGKKVVVIVSGGNIDVNLIGRIIDRGLIQSGRRLRVNVHISDAIGSLSKVTALIAKEGASVVQVIHDRNEPRTRIDETDVYLTLETRGPEHSERVVEALRKHVVRVTVVN